MLGIGGTELAIILLFGFIVFGPDKLPQMGRTIGRAIRQFRNAQEEMNKVIRTEVYDPLKDDEPVGDSFKDIFSEFTGDKSKSEKSATAVADSKQSQDADTAAAAVSESAEKTVDAEVGGTTEHAGTVPDASKTVVKKEVKGETFAEKKARLAKERAAKQAAKGDAASKNVADQLYGLDKSGKEDEPNA